MAIGRLEWIPNAGPPVGKAANSKGAGKDFFSIDDVGVAIAFPGSMSHA
jgi:hypothetical protein